VLAVKKLDISAYAAVSSTIATRSVTMVGGASAAGVTASAKEAVGLEQGRAKSGDDKENATSSNTHGAGEDKWKFTARVKECIAVQHMDFCVIIMSVCTPITLVEISMVLCRLQAETLPALCLATLSRAASALLPLPLRTALRMEELRATALPPLPSAWSSALCWLIL